MTEIQCPCTSQRYCASGQLIVAQDLDIGAAIEDLLLIWATTDEAEWVDHIDYLPL